ncbi:hypothetical protein FBEOM_5918 [Fusarium beomiforme]|uniref:Uncharacterized protein n=1 Tax=Fusarium beomiforme TaxID=44412 RepID=A0A9P5AK51_9HYPO|nr:hypothetical protein FBEOM_5918 [Fusarium beomiforme]
MASQSAAGDGSGENNNDNTIDPLRNLPKDVIAAQDAELKKENNELREKNFFLRFQSSQPGNDGARTTTSDVNQASKHGKTQTQEELLEKRGVIRKLKRQNREALRQSQ